MDSRTSSFLVEETLDALILLDATGRVAAWNPAAEQLLASSGRPVQGRPLSDLLGTDVQPLLSAGSDVTSHDLPVRLPDGNRLVLNISLRSHPGSDTRSASFVCALRDATIARVEQDRESVLARWGALFEALPDAIVIVNDCGRIVHANAQAVTLFGHAAGRLIGEPIEVLLPPRLRGQHLRRRNPYLAEPGLRPMGQGLDLQGMRADGAEFPVEISLGPIELDGRRLVISAIRDVSDRKQIERDLQQKNDELERASRAKDLFLASMSHELRTPLNAILGFTGLMLMRLPGPLTETQERQLTHVQSSGRHLLALINDLLDVARIESGHVELSCEAVPLRPVVEEIEAAMRPAADAKGLGLRVDLPDGDCQVMADRRALHQVLLNLVGNAVKYTSQGAVALSTRRTPDNRMALDVTDTGVGISPDDVQRLFQAFVRVGDRHQRRPEGTGLGLYLSHKLAELMKGRIDVDSLPGRGSTFTLTLASAP